MPVGQLRQRRYFSLFTNRSADYFAFLAYSIRCCQFLPRGRPQGPGVKNAIEVWFRFNSINKQLNYKKQELKNKISSTHVLAIQSRKKLGKDFITTLKGHTPDPWPYQPFTKA